MAKEWILNSAMNRFQFNFSRNVGRVSEEVRNCEPKSQDEWERYYFENVRSRDHVEELGRRLYVKITEVLSAEIEEVTESDCIAYMLDMVIKRTFDGYMTEKTTIYEQLEQHLNLKIRPASDEWDRLYNVDFYIEVKGRFIGLQIKPANGVSHITQIYQERTQQASTHQKFLQSFGGHVFYVISVKENGKKVIQNKEVIQEIKDEIAKLNEPS